jgi:hypothetical protein
MNEFDTHRLYRLYNTYCRHGLTLAGRLLAEVL